MDINKLRLDKGGNPEQVKEALRRRYKNPSIVDEVIQLDNQWRQNHQETNNVQLEIQELQKKSQGNNSNKIYELKQKLSKLQQEEKPIFNSLKEKLYTIPNFVDDSVIVSNDEIDNKVEKTWGRISKNLYNRPHYKLLHMINGFEQARGQKVAGPRGYFLTGFGALLNMAIINYGIRFLVDRGFIFTNTPIMLLREPMKEASGGILTDEKMSRSFYATQHGNTDMFLNVTSAQPLGALHQYECIDPKDLPIRYAGLSSCFRKEKDATHKDLKGVFRLHQFDKVEQFGYCTPENSWSEFESFGNVAEEFYQSLNIPYQYVNIVSSELSASVVKKFDLEGWFPSENTFRELCSLNHCTDYTARRLEITLGSEIDRKKPKEYIHQINATLVASQRALCCVLENYQTENGIKVPEKLQNYLGTDFVPFVRDEPTDEHFVYQPPSEEEKEDRIRHRLESF